MTDQCKHCTSRGNFDLCQKTPCHKHDDWMVLQLKAQLANSIPKKRVEALLDEITASCSIDVTRFLVIQKLELLSNNSINKGVDDETK